MSALAILAAAVLDEENETINRNCFKHRLSAFDLADSMFQSLFRLDKRSVLFITSKIEDFMLPSRIPNNLKVLVALRFFASGSYQSSVANDVFLQISQQSVSRFIKEISTLIVRHLSQEYIKFPRNEGLASVKEKFYRTSRFPGVIGAIDCTHVSIVTPPSSDTSATSYINRKGFTSINVQLIVDADLQILAMSAKFPGSVHDAFIWKNSAARQHISQIRNGWLLGDSGYPLEPWLITPFHNAQPGSVEESFNRKHSSARSCVERCNGVLKTRFRCLLKDRVLHYCPTTAATIINACAVLHNLCIKNNIQLEYDTAFNLGVGDQLFPPTDLPTSDTNMAKERRYRLAFSMFNA